MLSARNTPAKIFDKTIAEAFEEYEEENRGTFNGDMPKKYREIFEKAASKSSKTAELFKEARKLGEPYPTMLKEALLQTVYSASHASSSEGARKKSERESLKKLLGAAKSFISIVKEDAHIDTGSVTDEPQPIPTAEELAESKRDAPSLYRERFIDIDENTRIRQYYSNIVLKFPKISTYIKIESRSKSDKIKAGRLKGSIRLYRLADLLEQLVEQVTPRTKHSSSDPRQPGSAFAQARDAALQIDGALNAYAELFPVRKSKITRNVIVGAFTELLFGDRL